MSDVLAVAAFYWLLGVEVFAGLRRLEHAANAESDRGPAFHAGLKVGVLLKCLSMFIAGLYALDGSAFALMMFAVLVVWSAIHRGSWIGRNFGSGFESVSGRFPRILAATFGFLVVVVTRGVPLAVMVGELRA